MQVSSACSALKHSGDHPPTHLQTGCCWLFIVAYHLSIGDCTRSLPDLARLRIR